MKRPVSLESFMLSIVLAFGSILLSPTVINVALAIDMSDAPKTKNTITAGWIETTKIKTIMTKKMHQSLKILSLQEEGRKMMMMTKITQGRRVIITISVIIITNQQVQILKYQISQIVLKIKNVLCLNLHVNRLM
jgi:hypothetical protein